MVDISKYTDPAYLAELEERCKPRLVQNDLMEPDMLIHTIIYDNDFYRYGFVYTGDYAEDLANKCVSYDHAMFSCLGRRPDGTTKTLSGPHICVYRSYGKDGKPLSDPPYNIDISGSGYCPDLMERTITSEMTIPHVKELLDTYFFPTY